MKATFATWQIEAFNRIVEHTRAVAIRITDAEVTDDDIDRAARRNMPELRKFDTDKASLLEVEVYTHEGGWDGPYAVRPSGHWRPPGGDHWRDWQSPSA